MSGNPPSPSDVVGAAGFAAGKVIGSLSNTLDPEIVIVPGGVAEAYEGWIDAARQGVDHDRMDVVAGTPMVPATRGSTAALLGAAGHVLTRIDEKNGAQR